MWRKLQPAEKGCPTGTMEAATAKPQPGRGAGGIKAHPLSSHLSPAVDSYWLDPDGSQGPQEPRWYKPQKAASLSAEQNE